ncbi:MAG: gluconolaconase [Novosphingobium sp.]
MERASAPTPLFGANGLRLGSDGRLYVAQFIGSQISAIDLASGAIEVISPLGSEIVSPDDLAFDVGGEMYVTEFTQGRVSVLAENGTSRVLRDDLPGANGITFHQGRLFVDECRPQGRLMELDRNGGAPRILLEDIPLPNALAPGPDGLLYFPVIGANEIWRIHPDGGAPERVVGDLAVPDAVKFDAQGFIVSPQGMSGEVLRIDPRSGAKTVLARLDPGLDNVAFADGRLFVSNFNGQIDEVLGEQVTRQLTPGGLNWPLDLAIDGDGTVYVADGIAMHGLPRGGALTPLGRLFGAGYPGTVRGIAVQGSGTFVVTTGGGQVATYRPGDQASEILIDGLDQAYGVDIAPDGAIIVAETGTGRILSYRDGAVRTIASALDRPKGVRCAPGGAIYVTETGAGRITKFTDSGAETVIDGMIEPQGLQLAGHMLYVVEAGRQQLVQFDLATKHSSPIARGLPLGTPPGIARRPLLATPPFSGPLGAFAGIALASDGSIYLSGDAEGSVLKLSQAGAGQSLPGTGS